MPTQLNLDARSVDPATPAYSVIGGCLQLPQACTGHGWSANTPVDEGSGRSGIIGTCISFRGLRTSGQSGGFPRLNRMIVDAYQEGQK